MIAAGYDAVNGSGDHPVWWDGRTRLDHQPFRDGHRLGCVAGVAFTDGLPLRLVILLGGLAIAITYVMRYAARVRGNRRSRASRPGPTDRAACRVGEWR